MAATKVDRLPISGVSDGEQVQDELGNIYQFDAKEKTWIFIGQQSSPPIVNSTKAGLITPSIYEKLTLIETLKKRGVSFDSFKLVTDAPTPYFYYLYSSDHLIRFYPEGTNRLRLEIDRARLLSRLISQCCVGPQGPQGVQGKSGKNGKPAPNEVAKKPTSTTGGVFKFSAKVPTPIDTPISLRIFDGSTTLVEILIPRDAIYNQSIYGVVNYGADDGITVDIIDPTITIMITALDINYDLPTETLSGSIPFTAGDFSIDRWTYKARQRGAKGATGKDGATFFTIIEQMFDDPALKSDSAIISLRKPSTSDDIFITKKPLFTEVCTPNLVPAGGLYPRGKPDKAVFAAVRATPKQCKEIGKFQFVPSDFAQPDLDLAAWTPTGDCCDASQSGFDWMAQTTPDVNFKILLADVAPEQCCQEEFFWCKNVGDGACPIVGDISPPPKGKPPNGKPCKCQTPQPLRDELAGGGTHNFPFLKCDNSSSDGKPVSAAIDGNTHHYQQNVQTKGRYHFTWHIDWDDQLCGDGKAGQTPKDKCMVENTGQDGNGNPQAGNIPSDITFSGGSDTECDPVARTFTIAVNTNKKDCCRGYKIQPKLDCNCHSSSSSSSSSMSSSTSSSSSNSSSSSSSSSSSTSGVPTVDPRFDCSSSSSSSSSSSGS